jgi:transcriptional regulator with XRE-family HTH domain
MQFFTQSSANTPLRFGHNGSGTVMYPSVPHASYVSPWVVRNTAAAVLTFAYLVGTGGDPGITYLAERQDQGYQFVQLENGSALLSSAQLDVRSTLETLNRIRDVFRFSVSDLAAACNISRQAVYKWMSGNSASLESENQRRLDDLYRAAEMFAERGIVGSVAILTRKDNTGKTLVEAVRTGKSAQTWARTILDTLALEAQQRAVLDARLRARKRPAPVVEEWGIPMMSENDT